MRTFATQTTKTGAQNNPNAKIAQLVEHNLAKVGVEGSSPVFRSKPFTFQKKLKWETCPDTN